MKQTSIFFYCVLLFLPKLVSGQQFKDFKETGFATFYADKFNGKKTSSGERFSNKKLTAAHSSLPFGTFVKVTNLKNKKSVVVRINDRWPNKSKTIIDLSKKAAQKIGMIGMGTCPVSLQIADSLSNKREEDQDSVLQADSTKNSKNVFFSGNKLYDIQGNSIPYFYIGLQAGSFGHFSRAQEVMKQLIEAGFNECYTVCIENKQVKTFRVMVGKFNTVEDAELAKKELQQKGFSTFIKRVLP
jgi:rare lipoprotein A